MDIEKFLNEVVRVYFKENCSVEEAFRKAKDTLENQNEQKNK